METALSLLITYKYLILFPLAFFEGHMITVLCGFLWSTGYINGLIAVVIIIMANLAGDILWYYIGAHQGENFVQRFGKYFSLSDEKIARGKTIFDRHGARILIGSKLTNGFGLLIPILFASGMYRMNFRKYILMNLLGETLWSCALLAVGYYFGNYYTQIENEFSKLGLIGVVIVVAVFLVYLKNNIAAKIYG